MHTKWLACLALATAVGTTGCPSADVDENEGGGGPTVEFDPANKIIPFPNNLLLAPGTGKVNLPAQCNESATAQGLREGVLNTLDGFGTFKTTLNVTFTETPDEATFADHVFLYKVAQNGAPVDPATSEAIPVLPVRNQTVRFTADCSEFSLVEQISFLPFDQQRGFLSLDGSSTYVVGITKGPKTTGGAEFVPSLTWGLVRSGIAPVEFDEAGQVTVNHTPLDPEENIETLRGVKLLWDLHKNGNAFLAAKGHANNTLLLGWTFNTETTTTPLDPSIAGTPAATAVESAQFTPFGAVADAPNEVVATIEAALGNGACTQLPCAAVGTITAAALQAQQFQVRITDQLEPFAGPWSDPVAPEPVVVENIPTLASTPAAACAATGCPTVVFGHGLLSRKETFLAIAAQLSAAGFNVFAIDFVAHGVRAGKITNSAGLGCSGATTPDSAPQCYAPFLSTNLAITRDNIRQTVLDIHSLVAALEKCGADQCAGISVDPEKISYLGLSLGGIMGTTASAGSDFRAAVFNTSAVGWTNILENTGTKAIQCQLVNGLIDAGLLEGTKFPAPDALCLGEEWKTQAGYRQFAVIGQWVLDPADAANFAPTLGGAPVLLQEVVNDPVFPNSTTDNQAGLLGLAPAAADCAGAATTTPSAAIGSAPTESHFVRYSLLASDANCPGGNAFTHASLLSPAGKCTTATDVPCTPPPGGQVGRNGCPGITETCSAATADGQLGTKRLQLDAITFLAANNQ